MTLTSTQELSRHILGLHNASYPSAEKRRPIINILQPPLPNGGGAHRYIPRTAETHKKKLAHFGLWQSLNSYLHTEKVSDQQQVEKEVYSVWAIPPDEVGSRLKKLMDGLRGEFGGPQFEPHITVVGAIRLTPDDALAKFRSACEGLKAYNASVDRVATGTFFYQCVYLLLHPTAEVVEASSHCTEHFGYESSTPYMPHLSLLYGDLTEDEKKTAQEKANSLDNSISSLSFPITRLALYKTDTEDKTLKSWEKIAECSLEP